MPQFVVCTINMQNDASMTVLDDYRVPLLIVASFTIVIYNLIKFIVQATDWWFAWCDLSSDPPTFYNSIIMHNGNKEPTIVHPNYYHNHQQTAPLNFFFGCHKHLGASNWCVCHYQPLTTLILICRQVRLYIGGREPLLKGKSVSL